MGYAHYSRQQVEALRELRQMAGGHLTYYTAAELEHQFYMLTHVHRASGALYMAAWRDERGDYDHLFDDDPRPAA